MCGLKPHILRSFPLCYPQNILQNIAMAGAGCELV